MKKLFIFSIMLIVSVSLFAQEKVNADDIIKKINNGEKVYYKDVEIRGNLHLYDLKNLEHHKDNTNHSYIHQEIVFENCSFRGKVLGYFYDEIEEEVSAVQCEEKVVFKNCKFRKEFNFKYTEFSKSVDCSGSEFNDDVVFKYSKFRKNSNFANASFIEKVNFKYTKFDKIVTFENALFERDGNFKYAEFDDGVNFEKVKFEEEPNFKYARLEGRKAKRKLLRMTR